MDALSTRPASLSVREIASCCAGVHDIVGRVAAACPRAIALRQASRRLSYAELDRHARSLAALVDMVAAA